MTRHGRPECPAAAAAGHRTKRRGNKLIFNTQAAAAFYNFLAALSSLSITMQHSKADERAARYYTAGRDDDDEH